MARNPRYLIDTSVAGRPSLMEPLTDLILSGAVATHAGLDWEAVYSARNARLYSEIRQRRRTAYEQVEITAQNWERVIQVGQLLATSGRHRAVGLVDLLTAAVAEEHGLTVLHYDTDFETASSVMSFQHRWVAPRGSVD